MGLLFPVIFMSLDAGAVSLFGNYTIDATQPASTTNFRDLTSAITYLTSDGTRIDGGPANSAPFGVIGPVTFTYTANTGPYTEQVTIPAIPGASATNTISILGNGCTMQFNPTASYHIIRLNGADHVTIQDLKLRTTSTTNGFGVLFSGGADSNKVIGCTIDLTSVTSYSTTCGGVIFSASATSPTSGGVNGYRNLIMNDTILIAPNGGPLYTITNFQSSSTVVSGNMFVGNLVVNNPYISYYGSNTNGTLIKDNEFQSTNRTGVYSTRYDIYATSCRLDTITGNRMHNPFGTVTTTTVGYYGIYFTGANPPVGSENIISNNRIYDIKSSGSVWGIALVGTSPNTRVYHNTISLDHTLSTATATYVTYGFYSENSSGGNGTDFRNNIITITRGGASLKSAVAINTAGTNTLNNNNYYVPSGSIGIYTGVRYMTLAAWKTGIQQEQNSLAINPDYTNISTGDLTPREGMLKAGGSNVLAVVPVDAANNPRTTTPDIGAIQFTPLHMTDAGVLSFITPAVPFSPGKYPLTARIKNAGTGTLSTADVNWSVNGVVQPSVQWSGSLGTGDVSVDIALDSFVFQTGVNHTIKVWTSNPNGTTDGSALNDTCQVSDIYSTLAGGTYTINAGAPVSATNFTSFNQLSNALNGGITGPVTINVVPSSGPYNEQVIFNFVPNSSRTNTIVINGNSNTLQAVASAANYSQIRLNGAKHFTIQDLTIKAQHTQYGWGIHFMANADSNRIINNYIDLTSSTTTSTASVGIVFSNSLTSPTTAGENGKGNLIMGNTIMGATNGGTYYGITHFPSAAAATFSNNKFINNTIRHFYNYGIYASNGKGTLYKGNVIRNDNRTTTTTIYGFYIISGSNNDTIINNIIENPFGTPTTTSQFAGIYISSPATQAATPNLIANNVIRNVRSNGVQYGIFATTASNNKFYHNTIILDNPTSTSASTTYGIYLNGTPTSNTLEVKNNVVYINRALTNTNYNIYIVTATANYTNGSINNNVYFKVGSGSTSNIGYYGGNVCNTFAQWQAVNGGFFDAASRNLNPLFVNIGTNATPREGALNAAGANVLTWVPTDFSGAARSATPDVGAYEFTPVAVDAAIDRIIPPASPFSAGPAPVSVRVRNGGTSTLTGVTINWSVNGTLQTPFSWTGSLAAGAVSADVNIGNAPFTASIDNEILAWTSAPNSGTDGLPENDTTRLNGVYTSLPGGNYTINKGAPSSATNFTSFAAVANSLNLGGVTGAVNITVVPGSGPYTEQFLLGNIPGSDTSARVTIIGNNQELNFNNTLAANLPIIGFNNTKHLVLDGLRVKSLNATYGVGIMFTNNSDSNIVRNCHIDMSSITGTSSTASAGISFSLNYGALTSTAPNTGAANLIQNNTIDGGAGNGCYYGIYINATNAANPVYSHNKIIGNTVRDFYMYGVYLGYSKQAAIKNNRIFRPAKAIPAAFYGIYVVSGSQADTVEANLIYKPYGNAPANTSTVYGIYFNSTAPQTLTPSIIKNNVITDFRGAGTIYGIYSGTNARIKILHNTVNIVDPSTSSSIVYGIYSTGSATAVVIKNNIVNIEKPGSANRYALYFNTASTTGYQTDNNVLRATTATGYIGYYPSLNYQTLANWKLVNSSAFDQNSVTADPLFRNQMDPYHLEPGNDTLDNVGANVLTDAPVDFMGVARSTTPDPGAYNFATYPNDAGIYSFVSLGNDPSAIIPITSNPFTLEASVKNYGTAVLSSATVNWSVSGTVQSPASFSGSLAKNDTGVVYLGQVMLGSGINQIKAWTSAPNGGSDLSNLNDTFSLRVCTPISGLLSLNPQWPDTGSNFSSFASLFSALQGCGVDGPVVINVEPGVYSQQLTMPANIPGMSSVNTVTFDGGDSALCRVEHNGSISRATLLLDGARNYSFRNMTFVSTNTSGATAVQLINAADSNTFVKCGFHVPSGTSTSLNSFVASGSVTSPTTGGNAANYLLVDSCTATGGYYGGFVLYGTSSTRMVHNTISNSVVTNSYNSGMYVYYQRNAKLLYNTITRVGVPFAPSYAYGIDFRYSDSANQVVGNRIYGLNSTFGFYGIYAYQNLGNATNRQVFGNNAIDIGMDGLNYTIGLYDYDNGYADVVYNTIRINAPTDQVAYSSMAYNNYILNPLTYNNGRILNNIFTAPNGALAIRVGSVANLISASGIMDNNVFYSSGVYPFNAVTTANYITTTLVNFVTSPNMLGNLAGNNVNSLFFKPDFDSRMRSINYQLDGAAAPVSTITTDIEGTPRSSTIPDIGAYEFNKTLNDVGVVEILSPVKPLVAGLNDVKAVIRNFGLNNLTSCSVYYNIGSTTHMQVYTGNIATLDYDTVMFTATSGPGSSSQQYNFTGAIETISVWVTDPNGAFDSIPSNDTAYNTLCTGIAGNFTIDPAGSGPQNFTSIQAALDKLNCGGVYGNVVFDIAPGTYTGQYLIPAISGTSDTSTITFRSANNNAGSVKFTFAPATAATNYVFLLQGAKYINFSDLSFENTSTSFGRVIVLGTNTTNNATTANISVRNSNITGPVVTTTADANALVFSVAGNVVQNVNLVNNVFSGGSAGAWLGGPNIVNQFSPDLVVDSNTFNNQYYYGIYLTNRSNYKVRKNVVNMASTAYYGIYNVQSGGVCEMSGNLVSNATGSGYGISINTHAYYDMAGSLTLSNNVVNFMGGSGTQYGISISNSSNIEVYYNTIRTSSSSTSYGLYALGHAPFTGATSYPAAHHYSARNNIFRVQSGYALYSSNIYSDSAFAVAYALNRNVYYSGSNTAILARGITFDQANFINGYRDLFFSGSDAQSRLGNVEFTSSTNLRPNPSNSSVWLVNGHADLVPGVTTDHTGAARAQMPSEGSADIGAYEVAPLAEPVNATVTGTPGFGNTQAVIAYGDTVAWINWVMAAQFPTSLTVKYYQGTYISHPAQFPLGSSGHSLDAHWKFEQTDGVAMMYDITLKYDPINLGTIPSETDIRFAAKDSGTSAYWIPAGFTQTVLDTDANTFGTNYLYSMYLMTATTDIAPLPVKLTSFNAERKAADGVLTWTTAMERNAWKFEIERSEDGTVFTGVGEVRANGNTSSLSRYTFTDFAVARTLRGNQAFYRLKIVNRDGSFEYSEIRSIVFDRNQAVVTVYPNPFTGTVSINMGEEVTSVDRIEVMDVFGKLVRTVTNPVTAGSVIMIGELNEMATGVYFIKARINNREFTQKVIKQ